ncbi:MAG: hypothetical protein IKW20_08685 [Bacteroidales bacterium]|nr:hypothetical protein [Bacteroidales bacterium]
MAMTGGTAKLVHSGTPSGWPDSIKLYAYYKEKSRDIAKNETVLSLGMYITTPSGWNIGKWDDFYGSYIGTATSGSNCKSFNGLIPSGTMGTLWLAEDKDIVITHDNDGQKKNLPIYWKLGVNSTWGGFSIPSGVFYVDLTTIPRASVITSASNVTLGNACSVKWTPHSASFYYKLKFQLGDWSYTTGAIHPNTTAAYTYSGYKIPIEVANKLPGTSTGTMTVTLTTYSDSAGTKTVGSADAETFSVTVPELPPTVTLGTSPVGSLPSAFSGLYIQGKTKISAIIDAKGQYGASISKKWMKVDGKTYDQNSSYTSDYISKYGSVTVTGYATDGRGSTGSGDTSVYVHAYSKPFVKDVVAGRCDASGAFQNNGTYLLIKAKRSYSSVGGKNRCEIQYRYKLLSASTYSSWVTILSKDSTSDEVITSPLLSGNLSVKSTYEVQIRAVDDVGESSSTTIIIPTDKVFRHKGWNSIAYGGYIEEDDTFAIKGDMKFKVLNEVWESLGLSENVSPSDTHIGRGPEYTGCWYRVASGNHVQIAFNCAVEHKGLAVRVNKDVIPEKYRTKRNIFSVCPINGIAIAAIQVNDSGEIFISWIKDLLSTGHTSSYSITWVDGYIDYYL